MDDDRYPVVLAGGYYCSLTDAERNLWTEHTATLPAWSNYVTAKTWAEVLQQRLATGRDAGVDFTEAVLLLNVARAGVFQAAKAWHAALQGQEG